MIKRNRLNNYIILGLVVVFSFSCMKREKTFDLSPYDLTADSLSVRWDEGIPLGNGILGALIWKKEGKLRFALDRIDLWDLRVKKEFQNPSHTFKRLYSWWQTGNYQKAIDFRNFLRKYPYPTKIPGGALEFGLNELGDVSSVRLDIQSAVCEIQWTSGARLHVFVHSTGNVGWFRLTNAPEGIKPELVPPAYQEEPRDQAVRDQARGSLTRLGYPPAHLETTAEISFYHQETSLGNSYDIGLFLKKHRQNVLEGVWTIVWNEEGESKQDIRKILKEALARGFDKDLQEHRIWWQKFWSKSSIRIPDELILKQYYLEMYKFGSCTGESKIPISLQSVWTADNGKLPPWAGDFHHDLNTQLSYWPAYSGNHSEEAEIFVNWLWKVKPEAQKYTKRFFQHEGLAFPGVSDIKGRAMGGWFQYSHNPTVAAWLGYHFYMQYRYTMDREFLQQKAYPWLKETAEFFNSFSVTGPDGKRKLPLSSSPEINNDRPDAWFSETTNFDLALIRWTYLKAAELAGELGLTSEEKKWREQLQKWPNLSLGKDGRLLIAPNYPLPYSHRHFSHLMAIHPLGLIDTQKNKEDNRIISASLNELDSLGSSQWVGYSFSWLANLKARAGDGKGAAAALRIFAKAFCSPNSFHLNGDQLAEGYSNYTYRPFTLEGNFAFAAGVQEMLLQSQNRLIRIFPAIPSAWQNVSFSDLRAEGAFLISAELQNGQIGKIKIKAEKGGEVNLLNPFKGKYSVKGIVEENISQKGDLVTIKTKPGDEILLQKN